MKVIKSKQSSHSKKRGRSRERSETPDPPVVPPMGYKGIADIVIEKVRRGRAAEEDSLSFLLKSISTETFNYFVSGLMHAESQWYYSIEACFDEHADEVAAALRRNPHKEDILFFTELFKEFKYKHQEPLFSLRWKSEN